MENIEKPAFPWSFLSDPSGPDGELVAIWIFRQLQGKAYKGYLEKGPGLLVGPYLTDETDVSITSREALHRHANREPVGISVMYLPVSSANFHQFARDETLRHSIRMALEQYDPETQCVVLVRLDNTPLFVRIIGMAGEPSNRHTPQSAYYREILDKVVVSGLPN